VVFCMFLCGVSVCGLCLWGGCACGVVIMM